MNIIVLEDRVSEDPEVVNARDEVNDTKGIVLQLADVCNHIFSADLNPMAVKHEPYVLKDCSTVNIEDTIVIISISSCNKSLEEGCCDACWDEAEADTSSEDSR